MYRVDALLVVAVYLSALNNKWTVNEVEICLIKEIALPKGSTHVESLDQLDMDITAAVLDHHQARPLSNRANQLSGYPRVLLLFPPALLLGLVRLLGRGRRSMA